VLVPRSGWQHWERSKICITQTCGDCLFFREWDGQPFVSGVLAGNILLPAPIFFWSSVYTILENFEFLWLYFNHFEDFIHASTTLFAAISIVSMESKRISYFFKITELLPGAYSGW
jgi:hypothetical protein